MVPEELELLGLELLAPGLAFAELLADFLPLECRGEGGESVAPLLESIWQ